MQHKDNLKILSCRRQTMASSSEWHHLSLNYTQLQNLRRASFDVWTWFQDLKMLLLGSDTSAKKLVRCTSYTSVDDVGNTTLLFNVENESCCVASQSKQAPQIRKGQLVEATLWPNATQRKHAKWNKRAIDSNNCKEWCTMPNANFNRLSDTCTCASLQMQ